MHFVNSKTRDIPVIEFDDERQTEIRCTADVLTARRLGRFQALSLGFGMPDASLVAAAIFEVARNIVEHAENGEIIFRSVTVEGRRGLTIVARDTGPGIPDIEGAVNYGACRGAGNGVGLPGARLLVDDFEIVSAAGLGTTVTMTKWMS
ncbi:MAG TPA: ATP-binding protein [Opitutaceae bacterium]|nr:ATP-binding protein [Opitutaceae bacterium]